MGIFEKIAVAAALAAAILVPTLHSQVVKSKTTSVDSTSKEMIWTVNTWIADCVSAGGDEKVPCDILINMNEGDATVTDSTGKNDWNARKGCPDSLEERFEADFSARTFTAKVFIDESGYAVYSWFVQDDPAYKGDAPARADFEAGTYDGWKSEDKLGVTKDGVTIGTCPKLFAEKPGY